MEDTETINEHKTDILINWLIHKAYNDDVPNLYRDIFYSDNGKRILRPHVVRGLTSGELYTAACGNLFKNREAWTGHALILSNLSRRGFPAKDRSDDVNEVSLQRDSPFSISPHIGLIEGMMCAYVSEISPQLHVGSAVRSLGQDIPFGLSCGEALDVWLACITRAFLQKRLLRLGASALDDYELLGAVDRLSLGTKLACVLHHYSPQSVTDQDVVMTSASPSYSEETCNSRFVAEYCARNVAHRIFFLRPDDLLNARATHVAVALTVLIAELFHWLIGRSMQSINSLLQQQMSASGGSGPVGGLLRGSEVTMSTRLETSNSSLRGSFRLGSEEGGQSFRLATEETRGSFRLGGDSGESFRLADNDGNATFRLGEQQLDPDPLSSRRQDTFFLGGSSASAGSVANSNGGGEGWSLFSSSTQAATANEPLIPAETRPSKEKTTSSESKPIERGHVTPSPSSRGGQSRGEETKEKRRSRLLEASSGATTPDEDYKTPTDEDQELVLPGGEVLSTPVPYTGQRSLTPPPSTVEPPTAYSHSTVPRPESLLPRRQMTFAGVQKRTFSVDDTSRQPLQSSRIEQHVKQPPQISLKEEFEKRRREKAERLQQQAKDAVSKSPKMTSFAPLPNQTTWMETAEQQSRRRAVSTRGSRRRTNSVELWRPSSLIEGNEESKRSQLSQLSDLKIRLEQRKKQIERDKRKLLEKGNVLREKANKAAFLQLINKQGGRGDVSEEKDAAKDDGVTEKENKIETVEVISVEKPQEVVVSDMVRETRPKDLNGNANVDVRKRSFDLTPLSKQLGEERPQSAGTLVERRGHSSTVAAEMVSVGSSPAKSVSPVSSDVGSMTLEEYNQSLDRLNTSLCDLQSEIMRLSLQQEQITQTIRQQAGNLTPQRATWSQRPIVTEIVTLPQTSPPLVVASGSSLPFLSQPVPFYAQQQQHPPWPYNAQLASMSLPVGATGPIMSSQSLPSSSYPLPVLSMSNKPMEFAPTSPVKPVSVVAPSSTNLGDASERDLAGFFRRDSLLTASPSPVTPYAGSSFFRDRGSSTPTPTPLSTDRSTGSSGDTMTTVTSRGRDGQSSSRARSVSESSSRPIDDDRSIMDYVEEEEGAMDSSMERSGHSGPFFVSFGEGEGEATKGHRSKPKLGANRPRSAPKPTRMRSLSETRTLEQERDDDASSEWSSATSADSEGIDSMRPEAEALTIVLDETLDDEEVQRRRERVIELQARRRADREAARNRLARERQRRRDEQLAEQEAREEKKQMEKEKRESILQAYLDKKQTVEDSGYNPPPSSAPSMHRRTPSKEPASSDQPQLRRLRSGSSVGGNSTTHSPARQPVRRQITNQNASGLAAPGIHLAGGSNHSGGGSGPQRSPGDTHGTPIRGHGHFTGVSHSGPSSDYTGPKLYVLPKVKSNRSVIVNAISHCCLAGAVNEPLKKATLKDLSATEGTHFIILFRDARCQYRAIYTFCIDTEEMILVCGNGPRKITHNMADRFFKYNSGGKHFTEIKSTKHLSAIVDAISIHSQLWKALPSGGVAPSSATAVSPATAAQQRLKRIL